MNAFLLVTLTPTQTLVFGPPMLQAVRQQYPTLDLFDVDAFSDASLVSYARRLVQEAGQLVVLFQVEGVGPGFGTCLPLVEELMQRRQSTLVLLRGQHRRLKAILEDRPPLLWREVSSEAEVVAQVGLFLASPASGS